MYRDILTKILYILPHDNKDLLDKCVYATSPSNIRLATPMTSYLHIGAYRVMLWQSHSSDKDRQHLVIFVLSPAKDVAASVLFSLVSVCLFRGERQSKIRRSPVTITPDALDLTVQHSAPPRRHANAPPCVPKNMGPHCIRTPNLVTSGDNQLGIYINLFTIGSL